MKKAIKCGKLFDSATGRVKKNVVVVIDGEKIVQVTENFNQTDCEVIDLSEKFVAPGLIDAHVHISGNGEKDFSSKWIFKDGTIGHMTLKALKNAQDDLLGGFTTIRDAGGYCFSDIAVRDSINSGLTWGPRMLVAGQAIGSTGGHADSPYNPYISEALSNGCIVDGPAEAAKGARYQIKYGADHIKFMSTGGVMSMGTTVGAQQLTAEEMRAIIEVAQMYGKPTMTHAHGTEGIKAAIKAGVTSVEHGTMLDDECIDLMLEKGTYLVPTFTAVTKIIQYGTEAGIADWAVAKAEQVLQTHKKGFAKCVQRGVKIAFGTDAATPFSFHGKQACEFGLMCSFGMAPAAALTAATKTNSELLRMSDKIGSIETGKYADIVAFDGDPLKDTTLFCDVKFVMKDGKIYKQ